MIESYFTRVNEALKAVDKTNIRVVADLIHTCTNHVFIFGNGGSGCLASHFTQDMNKNLNTRFICLNDNVASVLAYANDIGFENIFSLQLEKFVKREDIVIGISCSGNSKNIINAVLLAKKRGALTIGFVGFNGGALKNIVDFNIHVRSNDMQICEDVHTIITHTIMKILC